MRIIRIMEDLEGIDKILGHLGLGQKNYPHQADHPNPKPSLPVRCTQIGKFRQTTRILTFQVIGKNMRGPVLSGSGSFFWYEQGPSPLVPIKIKKSHIRNPTVTTTIFEGPDIGDVTDLAVNDRRYGIYFPQYRPMLVWTDTITHGDLTYGRVMKWNNRYHGLREELIEITRGANILQMMPQVNIRGEVVWISRDRYWQNHGEVHFYDGRRSQVISFGELRNHRKPQINDRSLVVWCGQVSDTDPRNQIYLWHPLQGSAEISDPDRSLSNPKVNNNNYIVFEAYNSSSANKEIWLALPERFSTWRESHWPLWP